MFVIFPPKFVATFPYVVPTVYGQALIWTSPALAFAFFARRPRTLVVCMWAAALLTALPSFFYYANGTSQFGMRHALDFEPFLLYSFLMRPPVFVEFLRRAQFPYLNVDPHGVALTFTSPALVLALLAKRPRRLSSHCG